MTRRADYKPSYNDVVDANLDARGGRRASDLSDATITIGLTDSCTYNVLRPQRFLNDFLASAAAGSQPGA